MSDTQGGNNNNNGGGGRGGRGRNRGRGGGRGRGRGGRGGGRNNNRNRNRGRNNNNNNNNNIKQEEEEKDVEMMEVDAPQQQQDTTTTTTMDPVPTPSAGKSRHQFSDTTFSSLESISAHSKRALTEVLKYEHMTKVQEATLPAILGGNDVVAKAKTGSGKTTAFLLPIIERLSQTVGAPHNKFTAVVLSPTRELANQIAVEFQKLATFHPKMKSSSITMIGGTNIGSDKSKLNRDSKLRLLIATPGRLQDHLQQNTSNLVDRLSEVQILCLDEADRLLDMGFRAELENIMGYMPHQHAQGARQTLLFSATFPPVMEEITKGALRQDHDFIDTLDEDEGDTNVQVVQKSLTVPLQHHMIATEHILQEHIEERKAENQSFKIIVFFTTARIAGFMAELFRADPRYPHYNDKTLLEMHSRKSQSYRTTVAKKFTNQSNIILFSSDVSARGVDYPDVSCVLQLGAPSEKAQYIHRLGRTARAGNHGVGILLLCDFERVFLKDLSDLEVTPMTLKLTAEEAEEERAHFQELLNKDSGLRNSAAAAYQAFMGYYNSNIRRLRLKNKVELVQLANEYSTVIGFPEGQPPALQAKTVGKMGMKGVEGINVDNGGGGGRGGGGRGGGGRGGGGRGGGRGGGGGRGRR